MSALDAFPRPWDGANGYAHVTEPAISNRLKTSKFAPAPTGEQTIEAWYCAWRRDGIVGLTPKARVDRGQSRIAAPIQEAVPAAKRDNPRRSVRQIVRLLEAAGTVASEGLSRSAVHRLLQHSGLSQLAGSASLPEEKRSFTAGFAAAVW